MIETYYLIDYENVNSDGLLGCDKLIKTDHIIIFFTRNAGKINMSEIANHGDAELAMIEIPAGKQSADIHIGSYIGYLAGINKGKDCSIVVVSKDTDFDNVIRFWKRRAGVKASRIQQIKESTSTVSSKTTTTNQTTTSKKAITKVDGNKKIKLKQEVMQAVKQAGFENEVATYVAITVVKNIDVKNRKQRIYQTIISKYGQNRGLNIYNNIKKHI